MRKPPKKDQAREDVNPNRGRSPEGIIDQMIIYGIMKC